MATKKKQEGGGITLLSVYNDEDDDEIEQLEPSDSQQTSVIRAISTPDDATIPLLVRNSNKIPSKQFMIVDYDHDEEGEIESNEAVNETYVLSPPGIEMMAVSGDLEQSKPVMITAAIVEANAEVVDKFSIETVDALDKFLPPPPNTTCSNELQRKIDNYISLKKAGKTFNAAVRNWKDFRNPDFLLHAVRYQDIDQTGSCFNNDVFDPHGFDKSDYYDEIEADMKLDRERKEHERKKNPYKIEFISGETQPGTVLGAPKYHLPTGVQATVSCGFLSLPTTVAEDVGHNKKSNWDKLDDDQANLLTKGTQDVSTVGAQALLSSANVAYAKLKDFITGNKEGAKAAGGR